MAFPTLNTDTYLDIFLLRITPNNLLQDLLLNDQCVDCRIEICGELADLSEARWVSFQSDLSGFLVDVEHGRYADGVMRAMFVHVGECVTLQESWIDGSTVLVLDDADLLRLVLDGLPYAESNFSGEVGEDSERIESN